MRRLLLILLCLAAPRLWAGEETAAVKLERACFLLEMKHEFVRARTLLLDLAESPLTPPRTAAEALWLTAGACRLQGSDQAAILLLDKLVRDFPNAQPFTAAAAALAVELARGDNADEFSPNPADLSLSEDLARLAEAFLRLGDAAGASATLEDLDGVLRIIILELKLEPALNVKTERPHRRRSASFYEAARRAVSDTRVSLTTNAAPDQILTQLQPTLTALGERDLDPDDLDIDLRRFRDGLTRALGARDAAAARAAVSGFTEAARPLLDGPAELAVVHAVQSRQAALTQAAALAEEGKFREALNALRLGGNLASLSGAAGIGLVIEDAAAILPPLRFRLLGVIFHIESAVTELQQGGEAAHALQQTAIAIQKISPLLRASANHPACLARLERTLQSLREARQALTIGETGRATDLLMAEMYVTR